MRYRNGISARGVATICALMFACVMNLMAQSVSLFDLGVSGSTVTAKFSAKDATATQVSPTASDLQITENGIVRPIISVVCPPLTFQAISAVLTIDVSGTMQEEPAPTGLDLAKVAAHAWIAAMPPGDGECAITTYARTGLLNQDFTSDRIALNNAVDGIQGRSGTDYDVALINPPYGALEITKGAQYKRVIVLLTDGANNMPQRSNEIIAEAKAQSCTIYIVCVGSSCPTALRNIAVQTGGSWFEYVRTAEESKTIYQGILGEVQLPGPCTITWEGLPCPVRERLVELSYTSANDSAQYTITGATHLDFKPSGIFFGAKPIGVPFDTTFTITTKYGSVSLQSVSSSNPAYKITSESVFMDWDVTRKYTITYTPTDSAHSWAEFTFHGEFCDYRYYAHAGYLRSTAPSAIRVDYPNGGESLEVGMRTDVSWRGVAATTNVKLDYSTDDGQSWLPIVDSANSLAYAWNVPNTPSTECLARVTKHVAGVASDPNLVHTLDGHAGYVTGCWSPDGLRYATVDEGGLLRIWDPYTGAVLHSKVVANDNLYALTWSSDGVRIAVAGRSVRTSWNSFTGLPEHDFRAKDTIHAGNIAWSPSGAYTATAGPDNTGRVWNATTGKILQALSGHTKPPIDAVWSPDGTRLVTISLDNSGIVWDPINGTQIAPPLVGHTEAVHRVMWSPDALLIATASLDNTVKVWNASTHAELRTLVGPRAYITVLRFSLDGRRLLCASDKTVRIWEVSTWNEDLVIPLSFDVQDANWSHDGTRIAVVGRTRDTVTLFNAASGGIEIEFGGSPGAFNSIAFNPDDQFVAATGLSGNAKIWSVSAIKSSDTSDAVFSIVRPLPTAFDVDMQRVLVGGTKDSVVRAFITNNAAIPCVIDSVRLSGIDATLFDVVTALDAVTIAGRGSIDVEFRFSPTSEGPKSAIITVYTSTGNVVQSIIGDGYIPQFGNAILRAGIGSTRPGNIVTIPIFLESDSNLVKTGAFKFTGKLRFNATLLEPRSNMPLLPLIDGLRMVDFDITTIPDANGVLGTLQFRAALGNDSTCVLTLENVVAHGGNVTVTTVPGKFSLEGVCFAGGARLLNPNSTVSLSTPSPNPIVNGFTDIEIATSEIGATTLVLRDMVGRVVKTFFNGEVAYGVQTHRLDVSDIAAGAYMLTLRTPTEQRTVRIEVAP